MKTESNYTSAPWIKMYHGKFNLEYPDISLYNLIQKTIKKYPDHIALNYFGRKITYEQLDKNINICAKALQANGISKNDVVTICMPNTPEAIFCFYALNKIGAIANMIHPLSAQNEIKYYLEVSNSKMIITIDLAWEKVNSILDQTIVEKVVVLSVKYSMPTYLNTIYSITKHRKIKKPKYNEKVISWNQFIKTSDRIKQDITQNTKGNDQAVILYSGGTTGVSKGIVLTNLNFNAIAIQNIVACGTLTKEDKCLSIMPIFHGFGLGICIHTMFYLGSTAIILPSFKAKEFAKLLKKYKPNIIAGVPTLYEALLMSQKTENMDLSYIKCCVSGGDSLSIELKKKIDQFLKEHNSKTEVREGYGLTECVTASCLTPLNKYKEGTIGIPYPDTYYKIVKPNTIKELPYSEEGEIVLTGPTVMKGYLKEEEETNKVLKKHNDGRTWLHTGDLGSMDEEGFIYFKQRLKRVIISSGYNIYPQNIENIIDRHEAVLLSTVIGIDHPYKKQVAKAFVVLKNGIEESEELRKGILEHCKESLATYSLPYEIEFRKELPKTLVGKIAYMKLIEEENKKKKVENE